MKNGKGNALVSAVFMWKIAMRIQGIPIELWNDAGIYQL